MPVDKADADFAVEAANGGMMEVTLGKYAEQNAVNPRVKEFGAMMVRDHVKSNEELKQLAAAKNITLPVATGGDAQKSMDDLLKKTGLAFDKAYMDMMVDDHKTTIDLFEKAQSDSKDEQVKSFITNTLPKLKMHLDSAQAINARITKK
jgi:putative membrane protein